jgi:hypothetical protein
MKTPDGEKITDELLCKRFPHLFADRNLSMTQTAMCWGFEIGPGWMGLIYEAASKLEPLIVKMIDDTIKANDLQTLEFIPRASQIKEKYGQLAFYMTSSTDEMDEIIRVAEDKSAETCETCGEPGKLRGQGWYYTACDKCSEKREAKYGK